MPAAGRGIRFGAAIPKQYIETLGKPLLVHTLNALLAHPRICGIMLVLDPSGPDRLKDHQPFAKPVRMCLGGDSRAESVRAGLIALLHSGCVQTRDFVLVHDAVRPNLRFEEIDRLLAEGVFHPVGAILAVPVRDTIKYSANDGAIAQTLPRQHLWSAQTPQLFRCQALIEALTQALCHHGAAFITDEAMAMELAGQHPLLIESVETNYKVTSASDLQRFTRDLQAQLAQRASSSQNHTSCVTSMNCSSSPVYPAFRIGQGFDVHAFMPGSYVMLGGVRIAHSAGLRAHSDGDVVLHALCDALLGALALGDIGQHFPPSDPRWANVASGTLVASCVDLVQQQGWRINNVDITVMCEQPRLAPHAEAMQSAIAEQLRVSIGAVSIKATTTERLGFTGREEGIAAQAIALLIKPPSSADDGCAFVAPSASQKSAPALEEGA